MPNNKRWRITISGMGDETSAVATVKDTVKRFKEKNQQLTDARFVLLQPDDTKQSSSSHSNSSTQVGNIDLLADYGERSIPSSEQSFGRGGESSVDR
jgi:hypothetical protein